MVENKVQITIEAIDKAKAVLTDLAKEINRAGDQAKSTGQSMSGLGRVLAFLKSNWVALSMGMNQALELFNKVLEIPRKMTEWGEMGAQVMRTEQAFKAVAEAAGYSADKIIDSLKKASRGMMDDSDIMQKAGRMIQEGLSPEKMVVFMELLAKQAPIVGDTLSEAWDKLGDAISRGNIRAMKAYVGLVDLDREYEKHADKIGVVKERLTEEAKARISGDVLIVKMTENTKGLTSATESYAQSISKSKADIKNSWEEIYKSFTPFADKFYKWYADFLDAMKESKKYSDILYGSKEESDRAIKELRGEIVRGKVPSLPGVAKKGKGDVSDLLGKEQRDLAAFRLENEAKILSLQYREVDAIQKRHEAELVMIPEADTERRRILKARQAAELKALTTKDPIKEIMQALEKMNREDNEAGEIRVAQQELLETGYSKEKITIEQITDALALLERETNEAGEIAVANQELKESGWQREKENISVTAGLYKELFDANFLYAEKYYVQYIKMLDDQLEALRKQGIKEEEIEKIKAERIKQIRLQTGIASPFESIEAGLQGYVNSVANAAENIRDAVTNVFKNLEDAIVEFATTGKASFTDFANSVLKDMVRIMVRQQITGPLAGAFGNWLRGGGSTGYGGMDIGETYHIGGIVPSEGQTYRLVPRLHSGLSPDEYPAILQRGEGVFTPAQMKALGKTEVNISVINQSSAVRADVQESNDGRGSRDITVIVSEIAGGEATRYGSPLNRGIRQIGGKTPLIRR
jgi:hypothetical protein